MKSKTEWYWGFVFVIVAGIIAIVLSLTHPGPDQGLGGILLMAWAFTAMIIGIIVHFLLMLFTKGKNWLLISIIISATIILYGMNLHTYDK